jgi:hypothetical protein
MERNTVADVYVIKRKIIEDSRGKRHMLLENGHHYELPSDFIDKYPKIIDLKQNTYANNKN